MKRLPIILTVIATLALPASASASHQQQAYGYSPPNVVVPIPGGLSFTTDGTEIRYTNAAYDAAKGVGVEEHYLFPAGQTILINRWNNGTTDIVSYTAASPWALAPRVPTHAKKSGKTRKEQRRKRQRRLTHCGQPVIGHSTMYRALLAPSTAKDRCETFAQHALELTAYQGLMMLRDSTQWTPLAVPGYECHRATDLTGWASDRSLWCNPTGAPQDCVLLATESATYALGLRPAKDHKGRYWLPERKALTCPT